MNSACRCFVVAALLFTWAFAGCANHIPELLPINNKSVKTGELLEFDIKAKDDDGDPLKFVISDGMPPAARFDQIDNNTATFSWTPIASDAGPQGEGVEYHVTFKVGDGIDTSSETISIFVTLGGAGTGSPVFITPSDYTLDLDRTNQIECNIEVRDADSASITLRLVDGIPGGEFSTTGSKTAIFRWTPTPEQIGSETPVWGVRVGAKDESNPEVFQDITILLKGGQKKCEGTPPTLDHKSLPDQRGSEDYPVQVTATDGESEISAVALYWLLDTGGSGGSYQKDTMETTGGDGWQGSIPNPGLPEGQTATIRYYICARDDDDPSGSDCDMRSCIPEEGRFAFTAYSAGSNQCEDDDFESNDSSGSATEVTFDSYGEFYNWFLKICPANVDYFRMNIPQDHKVSAILSYTEANGRLRMDLLDSNGSTTLVSGQNTTDEVFLESQVFTQGKDVYLRVQGDNAQVANNYSLLVVREEFIQCNDDTFEPNNTPNDAKTIASQVYSDLACCGDPDWYKIVLDTGDKLEVLIEFAQEAGDLDLWVFDSATVSGGEALSCDNALGCGITETSNEEVTVESIPADGTYYIAVGPYQGAKTTYHMTVVVTPQTQECQDDGDEDNDTPVDGTGIVSTIVKPNQVLCPNDEDWYWVILDVDQTMVIDLTFFHADGDLDLKLYDSEVTPDTLFDHQLASSVTVTDNEHIEFTAEEYSDYNIRVYGWNLEQETTYSIGVTFQ